MTELRAGNFQLRPFRTTDAPAFAGAVRESMPNLGQWMPWAHAQYTTEEALSWIALCDSNRAAGSAHEFGIFTAEGELAGGAGLNQFNPVHAFCNLGYWIRESAQRQGAAVAATTALADYAFGELGRTRVEIIIAEGNVASMAVARKAGALHECVARNRLLIRGEAIAAHVYSLVPVPG